jgi:aspartate aminotransferase
VPSLPTTSKHALEGIRSDVLKLSTDNIAELARKAGKLEDVISLWYGEGDLITPPFIREAAKAALDRGMTFYVPNMRGLPALTEVLSTYQTNLHGRSIPVDRSTMTPGGMQAVLLALELVAGTGDNVLYIEPVWPNIKNTIQLVGAEPRPFALQLQNDLWHLDLDALFAACDAKTKAIFLVSPSNPTGWVASIEHMRALLEFSRRTGIWIISDEVYGRIYFEGEVAPSILQIADPEDRVMSVNSFSKAWAMTGWRIGWLTHPISVASRLGAMTQYMNSGTPAFIQVGAATALSEGENLVAEIREKCRRGRNLAYDKLASLPGFRFGAPPRGGMYVFFSLRDEADSKVACARILESARVGLAPGYMFGEASSGFVRACVACDMPTLDIAFSRIAAAFS